MILTALLIFVSCRKNEANIKPAIQDPVSYYSKTFLTDTTFFKWATSVISGNLKINAGVKDSKANQRINSVDSNVVYRNASEILTNEYFLEENYPDFFALAPEQQQQIFNNIRDTLTSQAYRDANPSNPFIVYEKATIPVLQDVDSVAVIARFAVGNISSGEFWSCATTTLGAALLSYGDLFADLRRLARNGGALTWGTVFDIAYDMVKNASPWWKEIGLALTFGGCLWNAGLS